MDKLAEVESAKELMTEAVSWSVMKWLREKKKVRKAADQANAALDLTSQAVKKLWTDGVKAAYDALNAPAAARGQQKQATTPIDAEASLVAKKVKDADDEAYRARMDAERTFDEAEKLLSTTLAREGCRKAILSWDLCEKAIRKAEAVPRSR